MHMVRGRESCFDGAFGVVISMKNWFESIKDSGCVVSSIGMYNNDGGK